MTITVHDFIVSPYAICMMVALIAGFSFAYISLKNEKIEPRIAGLSVFMNLVCVMLGGKLYTIIISPGKGYTLLTAAFSSVGGLLGMFAGVEIFNKIYTGNEKEFRKIYLIIIPLLYSVSKIGCFLVGCCHGIDYNGPGSILYKTAFKNPDSKRAHIYSMAIPEGRVFPVQITETIVFLLIFIYAVYKFYKNERDYLISKLILVCSVAKFSLEYLRADNVGRIINANQIVCILLLVIILIQFFIIKGRKNG